MFETTMLLGTKKESHTIPKIGMLEYESIPIWGFITAHKQYPQLGSPLDPIEFTKAPYGDGVIQRFGVFNEKINGIITQNPRGHISVIVDDFFRYFNQKEYNIIGKFGGYPITMPYHTQNYTILEFPNGDLVLTPDGQIIELRGEIGRYFSYMGGYEFFGFPTTDEIWSKTTDQKPFCIQKFTKKSIKYSHGTDGTFFTID